MSRRRLAGFDGFRILPIFPGDDAIHVYLLARKLGPRCKDGIIEASCENPSRLIHASIGVPPQVLSINPIGTCSRWFNSLPKKKAIAEKSAADSGVEVVHFALKSTCGTSVLSCSIRKSLTCFRAPAVSIACSPCVTCVVGPHPLSGISILDCPDANQTSPTSKSLTVNVELPATCS